MEYLGNQALAPLKLTMSSFTALMSLAAAGPISQAALAGSLRIRAQTVGKILRGLESDGLITRNRGISDQRSTTVALTDAGRELLQSAQDAVKGLSLENYDRSADLRLRLTTLIEAIPTMATTPLPHLGL
ncbi:MarR family transcriptional regulator [Paenarthrobacter sp. PH39-S1]|uniref:MarR family transcriptional regulator n=1 Tax=Paenarthrobacter sp. PH39-S1 TaxID=3046204 RepID=UPI0024B8D624|nr:MarR family transcriptional regulator [Paenarthrobacter sp. PH39-S1]MDJ0355612.1 MarR family transcriptional regulator [Paenarthrobacter sp. PH39-S1]